MNNRIKLTITYIKHNIKLVLQHIKEICPKIEFLDLDPKLKKI